LPGTGRPEMPGRNILILAVRASTFVRLN
jgi:hypothetical protein